MTVLIVARHGNTFNPGDIVTRVGGRTDLALVASGLEQGRALGHALKEQGLTPDIVYTSALKRAIATAQEAQKALGTQVAPERLDIFNEIDYGPDENKPEDEVKARLGDALKLWDEEAIVPEGWNVDPAAIAQNWVSFAGDIAQDKKGRTILVVTSNGIARFAPHMTGDFEGFRKSYKLKIATGAYCVFRHDGKTWRCAAWNVKPPLAQKAA